MWSRTCQWHAVFLSTLLLLILLILFVGSAPLNSQEGFRLRCKRIVVEGEEVVAGAGAGQHILCSPNLLLAATSFILYHLNQRKGSADIPDHQYACDSLIKPFPANSAAVAVVFNPQFRNPPSALALPQFVPTTTASIIFEYQSSTTPSP